MYENDRKVSKKTVRGFGHQEKHPENFEDILRRQCNGEMTLKEVLAEAGVSRTRWYEPARETAA